jgi:hypothetical protein
MVLSLFLPLRLWVLILRTVTIVEHQAERTSGYGEEEKIHLNNGQANRLLGYPMDARLLIINADDFGMCNSTNEAIMGTLQGDFVRSTTLMVPCPAMLNAMHFLADHPEIPFGVHLTVISDSVFNHWGPLTSIDKVPSLVDRTGRFYT